jgi:hypothetical protein
VDRSLKTLEKNVTEINHKVEPAAKLHFCVLTQFARPQDYRMRRSQSRPLKAAGEESSVGA